MHKINKEEFQKFAERKANKAARKNNVEEFAARALCILAEDKDSPTSDEYEHVANFFGIELHTLEGCYFEIRGM